MEEPSILPCGATNQLGEVFDFNTSNLEFAIKNPIQSSGTCHPRLKGVVSQLTGHWGAQIYANHQRIWLGTFKSEKEAAMAYDSAAIRLRNGDSPRNFPWNEITISEPKFQSEFSTEEILSMIKDGSYATKFSDYLRTQIPKGYSLACLNGGNKPRELFQKELTPSDVSKLNRLVIPKRYAVKYFPPISEVEEEQNGLDDIELVFFDRSMKSWKFRYCYWKSSQSFVFTRGWNRFAKEKGLKANDRVIFLAHEGSNGWGVMQKLFIIDVAYSDSEVMSGRISDGDEELLQLQIGQSDGTDNLEEKLKREKILKMPVFDSKDIEDENDFGKLEDNVECLNKLKEKGIKLFGVQIV